MNTLLVLGAGIAAPILFVSVLQFRRRKKSKLHKSDFMSALFWLIEGKNEEALEALKRTVKKDTDNVMAYIQLGMLMRRMNQPAKAAKIHKNLLVRSDLKEQDTSIILRHLMLDYQESGAIDQAIETAERLVQRDKKDIEARQFLLELYEQQEDWEKTFTFRQSINKRLKKKDQDILALYKVNAGLKKIANGNERDGRIRFREAIKLDKHCVPAYLNWGDSYYRENRREDAFKIWREFCQKNPETAYLVFDRIKNVMYDLGKYGEFELLLQNIIRKKPKHPASYLNLIEMYKKQGRLNEAFELCEQVLENHPDLMSAHLLQVQLLQQRNEIDRAFQIAEQAIQIEMTRESEYDCSMCGFHSRELIWRCPKCHSWNTFG